MRIVWTRTAQRCLADIRRYIAQDSPEAAQRVGERIDSAVSLLKNYPHLGRPGRERGTRELVIGGTPYLVPYSVQQNRIIILAVLHGAQESPRDAPTSSPPR